MVSPSLPAYIACLHLPDFLVGLARRQQPALRAHPLLIGGQGDRGVVVACCAMAAQAGVQVGMPVRQARQLCPQAAVRPGDSEAWQAEARRISARLQAEAPLVEEAALDTFFLDLTSMERFFGAWAVAQRLQALV
ncbi:MAG: DNA polymerase IV, partial [Bacteroidetes bacterium]